MAASLNVTPAMQTQVAELYAALVGRAPDSNGFGYWVNLMATNNLSLADVANAMYNTDAARAVYPLYLTNQQIISSFYTNVLGRTADAAGLTYWTGILNANQNVGATVAAMINSVIAYNGTDAAALASQALFNNKVTVGVYFATVAQSNDLGLASQVFANLAAGQTVAQVEASLAGAANGQTFTLTNSVDTIVGTSANDTINGVFSATAGATTATSLDSIDGGAGTDTINLVDTATLAGAALALPTAFTVKNVEIANLTSSGSFGNLAGPTVFDLSGWTGLTTANLVAAGTLGSDVKVADTTAVNLTLATNAASQVAGGTTVAVTNSGTGADTVTGAALTSVSIKGGGAVTIDNTDALGNTSVGTTLTSVTLDSVNANSAVKGASLTNVTIKGATAAANTVTVTNGTAAHTENLTVNGTGYDSTGAAQVTIFADATAATIAVTATGSKSDVKLSTGAADTTLTKVTAAGSVALTLDLDSTHNTAVATFDGSAATGDLTLANVAAATTAITTGSGNDTFTVTATTKATVNTGAGNDVVTLGSTLAAGSTVNLGDGNDILLGTTVVAASTATATTVIDGGAGFNSVSSALINAGNAAQFMHFQDLSLQGATNLDVSLVTGSTITALSVDAASSGTYTGITTSQALTDTFVGNNSANTTTLTFNGVSGTADSYSITFNGAAQTAAPGAANVQLGTVAAAGIENFTIVSGGGANTWNSMTLGADSSANTVTISGSQNLNLAFAAGFGSTTAPATGVSLIDGSAATGKLSINEANITAATGGITIKGGAGADTLTTSTFASTLTGGAGADTFNVTAAANGVAANSGGVITTITDATAGDKIQFAAAEVNFNNTAVDVSTATTLAQALGLASTAAAAAHTIEHFVYGGNTYLVDSVGIGSGTLTAVDVVVKLVGVVDLSAGHASDALGVVTLA